jgi:hypothetical protein
VTELEQIATACIVALLIILGAAAVRCGWVEGSASLRIVPPRKRAPDQAAGTEGDGPSLREVS